MPTFNFIFQNTSVRQYSHGLLAIVRSKKSGLSGKRHSRDSTPKGKKDKRSPKKGHKRSAMQHTPYPLRGSKHIVVMGVVVVAKAIGLFENPFSQAMYLDSIMRHCLKFFQKQ